jgi:hypothetical protein
MNRSYNGSWNESDIELFPGRLTVSPFTLITEDQEFYIAVTSIIIASAILPNGYIIVQILRSLIINLPQRRLVILLNMFIGLSDNLQIKIFICKDYLSNSFLIEIFNLR